MPGDLYNLKSSLGEYSGSSGSDTQEGDRGGLCDPGNCKQHGGSNCHSHIQFRIND